MLSLIMILQSVIDKQVFLGVQSADLTDYTDAWSPDDFDNFDEFLTKYLGFQRNPMDRWVYNRRIGENQLTLGWTVIVQKKYNKGAYPNFYLHLQDFILYVEVDEYRHIHYDPICETSRLDVIQ